MNRQRDTNKTRMNLIQWQQIEFIAMLRLISLYAPNQRNVHVAMSRGNDC